MFHRKKLQLVIFGLEAMTSIAKFVYRHRARKEARGR
jgi:hypothetical protein